MNPLIDTLLPLVSFQRVVCSKKLLHDKRNSFWGKLFFTVRFWTSLRSSGIRCEVQKVHFWIRISQFVCKLSIWLASLSSGVNHSLCLQTGLWILKWTFELRNEIPNFATNSEYYSEKLSEIDCKSINYSCEFWNELLNFATKFGILQWKVIWNRL